MGRRPSHLEGPGRECTAPAHLEPQGAPTGGTTQSSCIQWIDVRPNIYYWRTSNKVGTHSASVVRGRGWHTPEHDILFDKSICTSRSDKANLCRPPMRAPAPRPSVSLVLSCWVSPFFSFLLLFTYGLVGETLTYRKHAVRSARQVRRGQVCPVASYAL